MEPFGVTSLTFCSGRGSPRVWFHATKPYIIGPVVESSCAGKIPAGLLLSWSIGNRDKRTLGPLLRGLDRPDDLWCFADATAEGILEADALREQAAREGVEVRWPGVLECVISNSDEAELERITIPHKPISRAVVSAAKRLGIESTSSFTLLRTGRSIYLETILLKEVQTLMARHIRSLLRAPRTSHMSKSKRHRSG